MQGHMVIWKNRGDINQRKEVKKLRCPYGHAVVKSLTGGIKMSSCIIWFFI